LYFIYVVYSLNYDNLLSPRGILLPIFSIFLITFLLVSSQSVYADTIFVDTFDEDPQANGWTEKIVQIAVGKFPATATGAIGPTGDGEVVLKKTGGASALELSITRTINTIGFENIELELIAKQSQGNYENVDFILIEYSTGNGFQTLLKDHEVWNGIHDLIGEGTDVADGNIVLTSTGDLSLSSDADENSSLMVRLTVFLDEGDEDIFFGNFMIKGEPVDEEPPVLFTPDDITQGNDPGAAGAIVSFVATATDNSGPVTVTCSPDSDTFFLLGSTTVTCNVTDPSGNSAIGSFTVTVNDEELPVLFTPDDITQGNDPGAAGAIVSFVATATDNSGPVTVTCSPDSDTFFSLGSTTVLCDVTDPAGNSAIGSFAVTVNDEEPPVDNSSLTLYEQTKNLLDELESIFFDTADIQNVEKLDKKTAKEMKKAVKYLEKSLDLKLWLSGDGNRLNPENTKELDAETGEKIKKGDKVFKEESKAVKHLMKIKKDKHYDSINDPVSDIIADLVRIDSELAAIAIQDAKDLLMDIEDKKTIDKINKELKKANKELDRAQKDFDRDKPDKSIEKYKKAWKHAQHAIKKGQKFLEK